MLSLICFDVAGWFLPPWYQCLSLMFEDPYTYIHLPSEQDGSLGH